jgi:hypothetical protein
MLNYFEIENKNEDKGGHDADENIKANNNFYTSAAKYIIRNLNSFLTSNNEFQKLKILDAVLEKCYRIKLYNEKYNIKFYDKERKIDFVLKDNTDVLLDILRKFINKENVGNEIKRLLNYYNTFLIKRKERKIVKL